MRASPYIPILICLLTAARLWGQQTPFMNHYSWDPRLFNPASQGSGNSGEITAVYRNQFQELEPSIRPNTYLAHLDLSPFIGKRVGLALQLMGDKAHLISRLQVTGFFGYHLLEGDRLRLSLGAMAGLLNQKFDFDGARVGDVLDLFLFYDQVNATRFDGGPGLAFEYRLPGGSFFALDAAAAQLFSSDIRIEGKSGATTNGAVYDMIPHVLANARFRFQRPGFAVEPNVVYRALSGVRTPKTGQFDLNLNAFFLKENRLMVGGGLRSGAAGMHFQIGVAPATSVRLLASVEMHSTLGSTYEVGVNYTFTRAGNNAAQTNDWVFRASSDVREAAKNMEPVFTNIQTRHSIIEGAINTANTLPTRKLKIEQSEKCVYLLAQTGQELEQMQQQVNALGAKRRDAEALIHEAERKGETLSASIQNHLAAIKEYHDRVVQQLEEQVRKRQELLQMALALVPEVNAFACIRDGDQDCVLELLRTEFDSLEDKPADMFPLEADVQPGRAAITYHFPDDEATYALSAGFRTLAGHIARQVGVFARQGILVDEISLITELQEDKSTLGYSPDISYGGEFDDQPLNYTLIDQETGARAEKTFATGIGAPVSLEALAVLKLAALRRSLNEQGLLANRVSLTVRYNHSGNIYREETKFVLKVRE